MATNSTLPKKKNFLLVFKNKGGNVAIACQSVGIDRSTYYKWSRKDKKFDSKCKDIKESLIDFSESMLLRKIEEGNINAIIFHLRTKGKLRGYTEKQELEYTGKPTINVAEISKLVAEAQEKKTNDQSDFSDFESCPSQSGPQFL